MSRSIARKEDRKSKDLPQLGSLELAPICKAAADPLRLDILRVLTSDSFAVQELASIFAMPQPGMSHHLKILVRAGLLESRRQGNSIFYRRALLKSDSDFALFLTSLFATIAALPIAAEVATRIERIYSDRASQSRLYFERNAERFEENQGLLCELSQYLPSLSDLLDLIALPAISRVMEVGPGQGDLLKELRKRYEHIIALDNSAEMLALARSKLPKNASIEWALASLADYRSEAPLDAVVLNMVLHHMPSPLQSFQQIRGLLREGGYLLIADLGSHNQEWTKTSCGDLWLGFDPEELRAWGALAGFKEEQSLYLSLKNGFQVQLRLFRSIEK